MNQKRIVLTHWVRTTHICVGNLTIIGSDNGLSPGWRQAIIWTNAGIFLSGPWGTNFSEILIGIQTFSFKKMHFKMPSAKWQPFCLGFNELTQPNPSKGVIYPMCQFRCPSIFRQKLFIAAWFDISNNVKRTQETCNSIQKYGNNQNMLVLSHFNLHKSAWSF